MSKKQQQTSTPNNNKQLRLLHLSVAAKRALNRARIHPATTTIALRATLTLQQQTHTLGAAGRAALLDTHQATQKMRNHN